MVEMIAAIVTGTLTGCAVGCLLTALATGSGSLLVIAAVCTVAFIVTWIGSS